MISWATTQYNQYLKSSAQFAPNNQPVSYIQTTQPQNNLSTTDYPLQPTQQHETTKKKQKSSRTTKRAARNPQPQTNPYQINQYPLHTVQYPAAQHPAVVQYTRTGQYASTGTQESGQDVVYFQQNHTQHRSQPQDYNEY